MFVHRYNYIINPAIRQHFLPFFPLGYAGYFHFNQPASKISNRPALCRRSNCPRCIPVENKGGFCMLILVYSEKLSYT